MKAYNPFESRTGREMYAKLFKQREQRLELSDRIHAVTDNYKDEKASLREIPMAKPPNGSKLEIRAPKITTEPVSLGDLLDWYQYKAEGNVVGQEKALIQMTLQTIMLNSFNIEGPAGGGKTYIMKALTSTLPEDMFYWFEFATDTTIFNKAEEINNYKILVIPEYQKILKQCPQTKEAIKTITEGREAVREKTVGKKIKKFTLEPKCVITAIADENEHKSALDKDKEDMRRFSHIQLDTSFEQTQRVREFKRKRRSTRQEYMPVSTEELGKRIRNHIEHCIDYKPERPPLDPFAEHMDQYLPITDKSIAYVDDYYSYLDGLAIFHHQDRLLQAGKQQELVIDLADHFVIYQLCHDEFCKTLLKLDDLTSFGDKAQKAKEPVNWQACFEAGLEKMHENYPESVVEKWVSRQVKDDKISIIDPFTREEKVLIDYGGQLLSEESETGHEH